MPAYLGVDTSNYTTSLALYDDGNVRQVKRLLPVKPGERGLRQSDAVFHHTKAYPELLRELLGDGAPAIAAVGASVSPTTEPGSYMPCFLVGSGFASSLAAVLGVPFHGYSHQQGHIAAALYSAGKTDLLGSRFLAFHVSGGTTELLLCEPDETSPLCVTCVARSDDLKAGQAVDRFGVRLGLPFPAGKGVEELAARSTREFRHHVRLYDGNCSLSGLENRCNAMLDKGESPEDTARFLLTYIADAVGAMAANARQTYGDLPLVFAGGVMSDLIIRERLLARFGEAYFAAPEFSCDNAAGIAFLTAKGL